MPAEPLSTMLGLTPPCSFMRSGEGRDLLQRMLLPDPAARIQLEQIMVHPWFTTNLPPEAATMNESYLRAAFPPGERGGFSALGEGREEAHMLCFMVWIIIALGS